MKLQDQRNREQQTNKTAILHSLKPKSRKRIHSAIISQLQGDYMSISQELTE